LKDSKLLHSESRRCKGYREEFQRGSLTVTKGILSVKPIQGGGEVENNNFNYEQSPLFIGSVRKRSKKRFRITYFEVNPMSIASTVANSSWESKSWCVTAIVTHYATSNKHVLWM